MPENPLIEVSKLYKTYANSKVPVLKALNLSIPKGIIYGLLGSNGAGKTTLINILTGILKSDSGTIIVDGVNVQKNFNKLKPKIGIAPQEISLYPSLSLKQNLCIFGGLYGIEKEQLKRKVDHLIHDFDLVHKKNEKVKNLSGGMRRRLNLMVGVIHDPEIVVLDEPTVGVDVQSRQFIVESIKSMNKKGVSFLYTSHYLEEAEKLCDMLAVMDKGKVIASGSPQNLIDINKNVANLEEYYISVTGKKMME